MDILAAQITIFYVDDGDSYDYIDGGFEFNFS